jgi:carboxylesterase type B
MMALGSTCVTHGATNGPKAWKGVRYTPQPERFAPTFPATSPFDPDLDYSAYGSVCPQDRSMIDAYGLDIMMDEGKRRVCLCLKKGARA